MQEAPAKNVTALATPANSGLVTLEANIEKHHKNKEQELKNKIEEEAASVAKMQKKLEHARIELETDKTMLIRRKTLTSDKNE